MFNTCVSTWSGLVFSIAITIIVIRRAEREGVILLQRISQREVASKLDFHVFSQYTRTYQAMSLLTLKEILLCFKTEVTEYRKMFIPKNLISTNKFVIIQQPCFFPTLYRLFTNYVALVTKKNGFSSAFAPNIWTKQTLPIDIRLLTAMHEDVCDDLKMSYALVSQQKISNMSSKVINNISFSAPFYTIRFKDLHYLLYGQQHFDVNLATRFIWNRKLTTDIYYFSTD